MPIQKSFTKPDQTSGNYWKIANVSMDVEGGRPTINCNMSLWQSSSTPAVPGAVPMLTRNFNIPLSAFSAAQLNVLRTVCQNYLIANEPTFSGGTVV